MTFLVLASSTLLPGGPATAVLGDGALPEDIARVNRQYCFKDSVFVQYWRWLKNALRGDLGVSNREQRPVVKMIAERLWVTIEIAVVAVLFAVLVGAALGPGRVRG